MLAVGQHDRALGRDGHDVDVAEVAPTPHERVAGRDNAGRDDVGEAHLAPACGRALIDRRLQLGAGQARQVHPVGGPANVPVVQDHARQVGLAAFQGGGTDLAPVGGKRADGEGADRGYLVERASHGVPVGRLVDGARLDGRQNKAAQSPVPRAQVDVGADAANRSRREPRQDAQAARQPRGEGLLLGDHRVVQQDLADRGLG